MFEILKHLHNRSYCFAMPPNDDMSGWMRLIRFQYNGNDVRAVIELSHTVNPFQIQIILTVLPPLPPLPSPPPPPRLMRTFEQKKNF